MNNKFSKQTIEFYLEKTFDLQPELKGTLALGESTDERKTHNDIKTKAQEIANETQEPIIAVLNKTDRILIVKPSR